jgi:TolB-like protein
MRLAKIADLKVVSRTSTVRYKRSPGSLREVATQLGVENVLEGSSALPTECTSTSS